MNRPFVSKADNYAINVNDGAGIKAFPALLTGPNGFESAVVFRSGSRIRFVIPSAEAIRIANEIADSVESLERPAA